MADGARSDHAGLQRQLDRLSSFSPGSDTLGLGRVRRLLDKLDNPHKRLPPVFHVAGTNGKGSTCAYLRACLEAAGYCVHVYTSPHLVRFNERIRLAGSLISDDALAELLAEVLDINGSDEISFFEATTAAAFLAFSRTTADACIIEVGLGGRLDATNVIEHPAICGIAQLGIDHQAFLGDTIDAIAREKAGIAKAGTPVILSRYSEKVTTIVRQAVEDAGAQPLICGKDWSITQTEQDLVYSDVHGRISLPEPRLNGPHQGDNAALATAMLRHQSALPISATAIRAGIEWTEWPARMQKLSQGPLHDLLPAGSALWLDGGHNPAAARVVADALRGLVTAGQPVLMILGMLENKDIESFLKPFSGLVSAIYGVPVPHHAYHSPQAITAQARHYHISGIAASDPVDALKRIRRAADPSHPPLVLIAGSLYLAGEILRDNHQIPS